MFHIKVKFLSNFCQPLKRIEELARARRYQVRDFHLRQWHQIDLEAYRQERN